MVKVRWNRNAVSMIKITTLRQLRNREVLQVYSQILQAVRQCEVLPPVVVALTDTFAACLSDFESALKPPLCHQLTVELAELNRLRINEVDCLYHYLKSLGSVPEPDKQESASILLDLFHQSEVRMRKPYVEKTSAIENFLQSAETEPNGKYVHLLGIESRLSHLRMQNEHFQTVYATRATILSGITPGKAASARKAANEAFLQLCEMLNALALVNGEAPYKPLIDAINQRLAGARKA